MHFFLNLVVHKRERKKEDVPLDSVCISYALSKVELE